MKVETLERNYPNSVAQIRADERAKVLDEFVLSCKKHRFKPSKYTSINVVDYADIVEIAEQMKEEQE